jgi:hypothetical protein
MIKNEGDILLCKIRVEAENRNRCRYVDWIINSYGKWLDTCSSGEGRVEGCL